MSRSVKSAAQRSVQRSTEIGVQFRVQRSEFWNFRAQLSAQFSAQDKRPFRIGILSDRKSQINKIFLKQFYSKVSYVTPFLPKNAKNQVKKV